MVLSVSNQVWYAAFKIAANDMNETIAFIEKEWNKLEPTHPFRYTFLDQKFGALLRQQENFGTMFLFLTILAIIISAMGLYGLASYTAEQRTKEIGIRKALGAEPLSIILMILQESIFVTMFSGLFGLIIGLGLLELVGPTIENEFIKYPQVDFNTALITVFILVASGTLAGFIPAYRAAKIKPIVALRDQ